MPIESKFATKSTAPPQIGSFLVKYRHRCGRVKPNKVIFAEKYFH